MDLHVFPIPIPPPNILKEMGTPETLPASQETCMLNKKQWLELDIEKQTGLKLGKAVYCHPAYLTYMQNTSYKMLGWMKHKLELRLQREIPITSDRQMIPL